MVLCTTKYLSIRVCFKIKIFRMFKIEMKNVMPFKIFQDIQRVFVKFSSFP